MIKVIYKTVKQKPSLALRLTLIKSSIKQTLVCDWRHCFVSLLSGSDKKLETKKKHIQQRNCKMLLSSHVQENVNRLWFPKHAQLINEPESWVDSIRRSSAQQRDGVSSSLCPLLNLNLQYVNPPGISWMLSVPRVRGVTKLLSVQFAWTQLWNPPQRNQQYSHLLWVGSRGRWCLLLGTFLRKNLRIWQTRKQGN